MDAQKPVIIFDTDMDTDCDDAGALSMLIGAHKRGEIRLLAAVADAPVRYAAPCTDAILRYFGVNIPVGAVYEADGVRDEALAAYRAHRQRMGEARLYNKRLAETIGKVDTDYESAAVVYRRALSGAEDHSVTVVCVGFLTALSALFETQGDEISPLDGISLFQRKVKRMISMGEAPFEEEARVNFNYAMHLPSAERFFEKCPVPVCVSPAGTDVITGAMLSKTREDKHPVRIAYESFTGKQSCGRSSWDLIAVLKAMDENTPLLSAQSAGQVSVNAREKRVFWKNGARRDELLLPRVSSEALSKVLNDLML